MPVVDQQQKVAGGPSIPVIKMIRITVSLFNQFSFNSCLQRKGNSTPACNPSHSLFVRCTHFASFIQKTMTVKL